MARSKQSVNMELGFEQGLKAGLTFQGEGFRVQGLLQFRVQLYLFLKFRVSGLVFREEEVNMGLGFEYGTGLKASLLQQGLKAGLLQFRVQGCFSLEFRSALFQSLGLLWFRVQGRSQNGNGLWARPRGRTALVQGLGFRVQGLGFRVQGHLTL